MPSHNVLPGIDAICDEHFAVEKKKAENLVKKEFPKRIQKYNEALESSDFNVEIQRKLLEEEVAKVKSSDNDGATSSLLPSSAVLKRLFQLAQPYFLELNADMQALHTWITLLKPKVEDGNNTGVEIQELALEKIDKVKTKAENLLICYLCILFRNGKKLSHFTKCPQIEDNCNYIQHYDDLEIIKLRAAIIGIRDDYVKLYDFITKNWGKILIPRSSNAENMY